MATNKTLLVTLLFAGLSVPACASAADIKGQVLLGNAPIAKSLVTLWEASAGAPKQLSQTRTGDDGHFQVRNSGAHGDAILYLIASGGEAKAKSGSGDNPGLVLMTVLQSPPPSSVTINELTTVASAFTAARFISGLAISGNPLGLRIAAGNAPNLVDPATGGWGKVLLDPLNSSQTTTLANLDTLGSLITAFATVADDSWRARFFKAATPASGSAPTNTLEAMAGIAREPWADPKDLYALFDEAYPLPAPDARRAAPFIPYLVYVPDDFALSLCFSGGGNAAAGRIVFDAEGNVWSGQNWLPGSQSGVNKSTGGGVSKFSPNGEALSPPIVGFTGMGIDGVGWGTAVTKDRVWISSFNGKILVMDFNGKPIASESDFPFKEKLLGLMGIGVAPNGDVWIADGSGNQLLYFPEGRIKDGKIVKPAGLKSPFDIVVDSQNRVWVANSASDTVVRFPANDPSKVESFRAGIGVRALALDSKENVWVASNMDLQTPQPKLPDGISIMEQFKLVTADMVKYIMGPPQRSTGAINMIRPDGTQPAPMGFTGEAMNIPWGLNIDGNDDVWFGNMWSRSVTLLAGDNTKGHPAGTKAGDVLHVFQSGSIQMVTDASIDAAGDVWAANNWNLLEADVSENPARPTSTWGPGSGITVIYGVAAPVKPPSRIGKVQTY